nr:hypothetical protein [Candidatus Enterovibrio luxaltus]
MYDRGALFELRNGGQTELISMFIPPLTI